MKKIILACLGFIISFAISAQNWSWEPQTSPVTKNLNDVYFIDNLTGWAVGDSGTVITTTNGGQAWTVQTSGTTHNLTDVNFIDAMNGYAVGGFLNSGNVALKTIDGGATWTAITVGNTTLSYTDVEFSSLMHGLIITRDSVYSTDDAGQTWIKEDYVSNVTGGLNNYAVSAFNDSISIMGGSLNKTSGSGTQPMIFDRRLYQAPYVWGTAGIVSSFDPNDLIRCIEVAGPTRAFAAGEEGIVYKMETIGPNYTGPWNVSIDLMAPGKSIINSISFPTEFLGMFNTSADTNGTSYALIYHTSDAGATWSTPDSIADLLLGRLHAPTPNDAWIVGLFGKIYHGVPSSTGIAEEVISDVRVYPNPAGNVINIELNAARNSEVSYSVLNVTGSVLATGSYYSNERHTLNIDFLKAGVYFIMLENGSQDMKTVKFIKK